MGRNRSTANCLKCQWFSLLYKKKIYSDNLKALAQPACFVIMIQKPAENTKQSQFLKTAAAKLLVAQVPLKQSFCNFNAEVFLKYFHIKFSRSSDKGRSGAIPPTFLQKYWAFFKNPLLWVLNFQLSSLCQSSCFGKCTCEPASFKQVCAFPVI